MRLFFLFVLFILLFSLYFFIVFCKYFLTLVVLGATIFAQCAFCVFVHLVSHTDASSTAFDEAKVKFCVLFLLCFRQRVVAFELDLLGAL